MAVQCKTTLELRIGSDFKANRERPILDTLREDSAYLFPRRNNFSQIAIGTGVHTMMVAQHELVTECLMISQKI